MSDTHASRDSTGRDYAEFTIERFAQLCRDVRDRHEFLRLIDVPDRPGVLWRHDIDVSVRAALRMAELEAELGVMATYFFLPHSQFHNLAAPDEADMARRIVALGHDAGLHFDPTFYDPKLATHEYEQLASAEKGWLEGLLAVEVGSISFHNFGLLGSAPPSGDRVAGMVNAYGDRLRERYHYVSDSNGIWRFENLFTVVESGRYERLHALTHPVWWTDHPLPPRQRLQHWIDEGAAAMGDWYDAFTARYGTPPPGNCTDRP